jgi:hypothetical protein
LGNKAPPRDPSPPEAPRARAQAQARRPKAPRPDAVLRKLAADLLGLPAVCAEAACRRARACVAAGAPCLARHRTEYELLRPALSAAIRLRMAELARPPS